MPLYEVAIVHIDEDDRETLVHGPVAVTAMNGERAKLKVFRDFNLRDLDQDELTILSRPFGTGM